MDKVIVSFHDYKIRENFAFGENLSYKEVAKFLKEQKTSKGIIKFAPHNFEDVIKDHKKLSFLKKGDVLVNTTGSFAWYYYYLRKVNKQEFRIVHFCHTSFFCTYLLQEVLCSRYMRKDDLVIFNSEFQRQLYMKLFDHLNENNTTVCLPLLRKPSFRKSLLNKKNTLTLGWIGDISEAKGFNFAIDGFVKLSKKTNMKIRFLVCGENKDQGTEVIIKRLKLEKINPKNFMTVSLKNLDYDKLDKIWKEIDILLFPSVCGEPLGRVVMEATDRRIPVVGSFQGGVPEIVDKKNLVPVNYFNNIFSSEEVKPIATLNPDEIVKKCLNYKQLIIKKIPDYRSRKKHLLSSIVERKIKSTTLEPEIKKVIERVTVFLDNTVGYDFLLKKSISFLKKQKKIKAYQTAFDLCRYLGYFPKFMIRKKRKALFISPHIDDAILYAGNVILDKLNKGYDVKVINVFSKKSKVNDFVKRLTKKHTINIDSEIKIKEEEKISNLVDISFAYLPYVDGLFLVNSEEELFKRKRDDDFVEVLNLVQLENPDEVYMPTALNNHIDHRAIFNLIKKIFDPKKTEFYLYGDSYMGINYENKLAKIKKEMDIEEIHRLTEYKKKKKKLLGQYKSQKGFINKHAPHKERLWKINGIKQKNHSKPELVIAEITQKCNLDCIMCYNKDVEKKEVLTTSELKNFIDQLKEVGCMVLSLTGGEPLLRKDTLKLVRYAQSLGIKCVIYTNGTLLDKYAKHIIKSGLSKLFISLDSHDEKKFEEIRGQKKIFSKVIKGIKKMVKLKKELRSPMEIRTAAVIIKQNVEELLELVDFSRKLGVDGITFKPITISTVKFSISEDSMFRNNLKKKTEFWPTSEQLPLLNIIFDKLSEIHEQEGFVWETRYYFETLKKYFENPSNKYIDIRCKKGYNYFVLDKDGYVLPCWGFRPRDNWNIRVNQVKDIWNSKKYMDIRRMMETCNHPCTDMLEYRTYMR